MSTTNQIRDDQMESYVSFFGGGSSNAISGLAEMVGQTIEVTSTNVRRIAVKDAPELIGGWEELVVGVYLGVSGSANGHIFLAYQPKTAMELVDLMMGEPLGTTQVLGEMEQSALGELGNVMGSYFLNNLADAAGLELYPSPPAVMKDMAGAILDVVLADILQESDEVLVVESNFCSDDRQISGTFLVLPSPDLLRVLDASGSKE